VAISTGKQRYTLGFRVALEDAFSKQAQQVKSSLKGISKENQIFNQSLLAARNTYGGIAAAGTAAIVGLGAAVQTGAEFEYVMKGVKAVSQSTVQQYQELSRLAMDLAGTSIFMPGDLASGMRYMAMAGFDAATIAANMKATQELAMATMTALGGKGGTADIMTNIMKGFNLGPEKAAEVSDILTTAVTNANISLIDMGNTMRYVAATASDLNLGVDTVSALAMTLGNAGIQGSMAGTAIENMLRYLAMGLSEFRTGRQSSAWESMGLSPSDVVDMYGNLLPIEHVLGKIREQLLGSGNIRVQGVLKEIFGVRGKRGASTVARNLEDFIKFQDMLRNHSEGRTSAVVAEMMDSLSGSFNKLRSEFVSLQVAFTDAVGPMIRPVVDFAKMLLTVVKRFVQTPFGAYVAGVTSMILVVGTLTAGFKALVAAMGYLWKSGLTGITQMNAALSITLKHMLGLQAATMSNAAISATQMAVAGPGAALLTRQAKPNIPAGQNLKYSQQRGMFYMTPPRGSKNVPPTWFPKNLTPAPPQPTFAPRTTVPAIPIFARMSGFLGKILGILGPIGMIAAIALPVIPMIARLLNRSNSTSERIANSLSKKEEDRFSKFFSNRQVIEVLGPKTLLEIATLLRETTERLKELHGIRRTNEILEERKDDAMGLLMEVLPHLNTSKEYQRTQAYYGQH
jgi:TP901 family phage tail tape measure protein